MSEPLTFCSACNARVYAPLNVVEVSRCVEGSPWLGRALLCHRCLEWAMQALHTKKVASPVRPATLPFRGPVR